MEGALLAAGRVLVCITYAQTPFSAMIVALLAWWFLAV